jgi:hypothetical protein
MKGNKESRRYYFGLARALTHCGKLPAEATGRQAWLSNNAQSLSPRPRLAGSARSRITQNVCAD